mmetsp:Transcript_8248/g.26542  ORF Transcript_8248/g.26542 Transcript_8248/m.26542 type:complete len:139 (-) Transcript_8248:520-936(-)|eukprot:scaffold3058_cov134-Isochrysis_galbana.AAC.7
MATSQKHELHIGRGVASGTHSRVLNSTAGSSVPEGVVVVLLNFDTISAERAALAVPAACTPALRADAKVRVTQQRRSEASLEQRSLHMLDHVAHQRGGGGLALVSLAQSSSLPSAATLTAGHCTSLSGDTWCTSVPQP